MDYWDYLNKNTLNYYLQHQQDILEMQMNVALQEQMNQICQTINKLNSSMSNACFYHPNVNYLEASNFIPSQPKKKTLEDLERELFPDNPIRDYIEKKMKQIEEKYQKIFEYMDCLV